MAGREVPGHYKHAFLEGVSRYYFSEKLYKAVDRPWTDAAISWSQDGKSFIITDPDKFSRVLAPWFGYSTLSTFLLHLNALKFRKVESEHEHEYAHDYFMRGKPEIVLEIEKQLRASLAPEPITFKSPPGPAYAKAVRDYVMAENAAKKLSLKDSTK